MADNLIAKIKGRGVTKIRSLSSRFRCTIKHS